MDNIAPKHEVFGPNFSSRILEPATFTYSEEFRGFGLARQIKIASIGEWTGEGNQNGYIFRLSKSGLTIRGLRFMMSQICKHIIHGKRPTPKPIEEARIAFYGGPRFGADEILTELANLY